MAQRSFFKNSKIGILCLIPQVSLVLTFFYWPAAAALYWAFTLEQPWGGGSEFVGLDNFTAILNDRAYWNSVFYSLVFTIGSTILVMGMGLIMALFCERKLRGYQWYQSALIWPFAVAAPAAGVAFRFIFTPEAGLLGGLNKISPDFWNPSQTPVHAMILIILAYSWKYVAYNFIFLLAGLQSIPKPLIEASAIDGASVLRRVTDIQIPLLAPVIFFLLMINITDSFVDSFGIVDITTRGGPSKSTTLMVYKIYFDGFRGLDYSGAAAQSVILMFLIMTLTFVQFKWIEKRVHYG